MDAKEWRRDIGTDKYLISTARHLLSDEAINEAFSSDDMFWTKRMSREELTICLDNSLTLGLYIEESEGQRQVGFARLITDRMTFAYLTDVFVLPELRGQGLAKWLMVCINELVQALPHLRQMLLMARDQEHTRKFYADNLNAHPFVKGQGGGGGTIPLTAKKVSNTTKPA